MSLYANAVEGKWITFRLNPEHYARYGMVKRPRQILVGQVFKKVDEGTLGVYSHDLEGKAVHIVLEDVDVHFDNMFAATILEVFDARP